MGTKKSKFTEEQIVGILRETDRDPVATVINPPTVVAMRPTCDAPKAAQILQPDVYGLFERVQPRLWDHTEGAGRP